MPLFSSGTSIKLGTSPVAKVYLGTTTVWTASTTSPKHSVWGTTVQPGTYGIYNDGGNIRLGGCFYRYTGGSGTYYTNMRIVGGKLYKASSITLPTGNITFRAHTNPAGFSAESPPSFGTLVASKTVASSTMVTGWNEVMFDAPQAMPGPGGLVVISYKFDNHPEYYLFNGNARFDEAAVSALDGTKLAWSEHVLATNYYGAVYETNDNTYGHSITTTTSYGVDIIVDEG